MSVAFHIALPLTLLVSMILWVAGGLWCERKFSVRGGDSLIWSAITFVCGLLWLLGLIAALLMFGGSLLGLFLKLFIQP